MSVGNFPHQKTWIWQGLWSQKQCLYFGDLTSVTFLPGKCWNQTTVKPLWKPLCASYDFKMWSFLCWFSHGADSILQELQRKPEHPGVVNLYFPERCKPNCSKEKQMNRKTLSGMWSVHCVVSCGNTRPHKTWGWDWCTFVYTNMFFLIKMSQHLPLFQNDVSEGSCVYSGNQPFSLEEGSRYILSITQTQFCC